ncbi:hypothetical protein [Streptomyces tropicalis]|uniref:Ribbon-helix-helix protein CopG domain-containing protein n=1 Tax=Streptomyces tropicalis TaxID=3034234 RepID=A0ABT6AAR9_9ACTN|nr:hypothetical protein [Streptomyces tropicalis]MDF3300905.1 hypothetical protein [Streptomyces tropicalis]
MPALNVDFSEEEFNELREVAKELRVPMKALVKAATADHIARHRPPCEAEVVFQRTFAGPDLAAAITAAGVDDGPVRPAA